MSEMFKIKAANAIVLARDLNDIHNILIDKVCSADVKCVNKLQKGQLLVPYLNPIRRAYSNSS